MQEKIKTVTDALDNEELAELTEARELTDTDLTHVTGGFFKWGGGNGWGYGYGCGNGWGYGYGCGNGWGYGYGCGKNNKWGYGYGCGNDDSFDN